MDDFKPELLKALLDWVRVTHASLRFSLTIRVIGEYV
jgi:hypothetical protein